MFRHFHNSDSSFLVPKLEILSSWNWKGTQQPALLLVFIRSYKYPNRMQYISENRANSYAEWRRFFAHLKRLPRCQEVMLAAGDVSNLTWKFQTLKKKWYWER